MGGMIEEELDALISSKKLMIYKMDNINCILNELSKKFKISTENDSLELWEQLSKNNKYSFCNQDVNGWMISVEKIEQYPCIFLIFSSTDKVAYKVQNKVDLIYLLSESTGFTYYLCSIDFNKILFYNFHDVLAVFNSKSLVV